MTTTVKDAGHPVGVRWDGWLAVGVGSASLLSLVLLPKTPPDWRVARLVVQIGTGVGLLGWGVLRLTHSAATGLPDARRRRRQDVRLTLPAFAALAIMMVLFVGALIGRSNPLMLVGAMIAGPFVINGWMAHTTLRGIDVRRRVERRGSVGEPLWVELTLENRKRWFATWLTAVRDEVVSDEESLSAEVVFTRTPPGGASTGRYELLPMRRGRYVLGPVSVQTSFPIGFVERTLRIEDRTEVLVHPRIGRLSAAWARRRTRDSQVRAETRLEGSREDEFQKLRDYRFGDSVRKIHWRTSARRNELVVRDDRWSSVPPYSVLLDLWQPADASDEDLERVELAVGFVATLCVEQLRQHRESTVELAVAGREALRSRSRSGAAAIEGLLDELAVVRGDPAADPGELVEQLSSSPSARSTVVLVTTRPRGELDAALARLSPEQRRRIAEADVIEASPGEMESLYALS